jgi:uncharacterized membrane protein
MSLLAKSLNICYNVCGYYKGRGSTNLENSLTEEVNNDVKAVKRAGFLDEVRGFAILCMVVYHTVFVLKEFYGINVPFFFEDWFYVIWAVFAGSFVFISGIVCRYSSNNIKRGAQCFMLGMLVTFVTALVVPQVSILFGILHFLGISMILFGLSEDLLDFASPAVAMAVCAFLMAITWNIQRGIIGIGALSLPLPDFLYDAGLLFPLGFMGEGFTSGDYFPLMPWAFLFFAGAYFGVYVKNGSCPSFFYKVRVPFFAAVGRYTIWIYLFHQPIVMGVLYLIFGTPNITLTGKFFLDLYF